MGRAARDARLETRTARAELRARHEPYWRQQGPGLAIGYRKGPRGGRWSLRHYDPVRRTYTHAPLGAADDTLDADGRDVLTYFQAAEKARALVKAAPRHELGTGVALTVNEALDRYLEWYAAHRRGIQQTRCAIDAHIRPALGGQRIAELSPRQLRHWMMTLVDSPRRTRRKVGSPPPSLSSAPADPELRRRRQASANRIWTILKAALNHAWREGLVADDHAWRRVQPFERADQPRIRYLTAAECTRFLKHCAPDFRLLAAAALLTGCRLGELTALRVGDFDPEAGTVHLTETKSGSARHVPLTAEGIELCARVAAGRGSGERLFLRADGSIWGLAFQRRPMLEACQAAKINPPISFHVLRHTYASLLVKARVPLSAVADLLGHSDTRITKRHYAHMAPGFLAREVRRALPIFKALDGSLEKSLDNEPAKIHNGSKLHKEV